MEKELQVVTVPRGTRKTVLALDMQELTTEMGLEGGGNRVPEWGVTIRLMITPQGMHKPF